MLPSSVADRLDRLAPDQREAATAPPGPVLCVAPAGSGKTTTLVARIAWLVATGADPATMTAVTFNKRAADEMAERVDAALEPLGLAGGSVRVKTFHALGREILADGGERVEPLLDREAVLRDMWPDIDRGALRRAVAASCYGDVGAIDPVGLKVPVFGSYSSAEARSAGEPSAPPATNTRPSRSCVAAWSTLTVLIEPVGLNMPVFGSYSSAEAWKSQPSFPPATRTRPSARRVAVKSVRAVPIEPVGLKVPVLGSYNSAEA
jgi:hypothetical protein